MSRFKLLGIYLTLAGLLFFIIYELSNILLYMAFSISCFLLGTTLLILPYEEREKAFIKGITFVAYDFYANLEKILKEFNIKDKGIYTLIRTGGSTSIRVIIPIAKEVNKINMEGDSGLLYTTIDNIFLNIIPPGFSLIKILMKEGIPLSSELSTPNLQEILYRCLVDILELCKSVTVTVLGNIIIVRLNDPIKEFYELDKVYPRAIEIIGSPYAAFIASILSYITRRNIKVLNEEFRKEMIITRFEVL